MKRRLVFILSIMMLPFFTVAQIVDNTKSEQLNRMLSEQIERIAEDGDEDIDFEELINDYIFYSENPVNINDDNEIDRLAELRIIDPIQIGNIKNYRRRYGDFLFIEELAMVDGIDERTAALITPLVRIKGDDVKEKITGQKLGQYGKHQLTFLYGQVLEKQQGYENVNDSILLDRNNSRYLGSPQRYMIRYSYNYRDRIRVGFVAEKDPGEALFYNRYSDTIKALIGNHRNYGFDFYGLYAYINDFGILRDAVIGDYQLSFGQGLTLWNGMSYGKIGAGSSTIKQARGIKPKTSATETGFLRGTAATLYYKGVSLTAFYSFRKIDANLEMPNDTIDDEDERYATSLQETGYHRTIGELQDRHAISQHVFGGHVSYANSHFEVGYTAYHTILGTELVLKPSKYNQFYFQGKSLTVQGIDFKYVIPKFAFYGEASMSGTTGFAGLVGLTASPTGYINFTLTYRNYGKKYQNLFSNAFGENSRNQGEEGYYVGLQATPLSHWKILAYADFFRFKWLTSQAYAPSWGQDYYIKTEHQINKNVSLYLLFRSKSKMKNSSLESYSYYPIPYSKQSVRFNISYQLGDFKLSNKVQYSHYKDGDGTKSNGYFVCQDIAYKPTRFKVPFGITFRYALFDSDDYDSRVYAYENDVLYTFSVPAFYDKGMRLYLLGSVKLFNCLSLYGKIGCTIYANKDEISSGLSLIKSNHRTDLKLEAIWKF